MLFGKPFQDIGVEDIHELVATKYPESDLVEFKEAIPGRDGPDNWHKDQSKGIGDYARDRLLSEIIAFANTHGGHLIVGIEESTEKPSRAISVKPIPACHDLAERLRQAATACIAPSLGKLQIKGINTDDASNGVIVVRVGQSVSAPHRLESNNSSFARHCYVRRGTSTETLTMREVQDLTLNLVRGLEGVERKFASFRGEFEKRAKISVDPVVACTVGVRCSAVPLSDIRVDRESINQVLGRASRNFKVRYSNGKSEEISVHIYGNTRAPVLRGARIFNETKRDFFEHAIYVDGSINGLITYNWDRQGNPSPSPNSINLIYADDILAQLLTLLHSATNLAEICQAPGVEFGVQVQVSSQTLRPLISVAGPYSWQQELPNENFVFPDYSFSPDQGLAPIVDQVLGDILNATGLEQRFRITDVT